MVDSGCSKHKTLILETKGYIFRVNKKIVVLVQF